MLSKFIPDFAAITVHAIVVSRTRVDWRMVAKKETMPIAAAVVAVVVAIVAEDRRRSLHTSKTLKC